MVLWPITRISCNSATDSSSSFKSNRIRSRLGSATTLSVLTIDGMAEFCYISTYHDTTIKGEENGNRNPRRGKNRQVWPRLQGGRPGPGRLGPQRDRHRRAGDAGPDGDPQ